LFSIKSSQKDNLYFSCREKKNSCTAIVLVKKTFCELSGAVTYQALKLMGGAHNHGEQVWCCW